jgi:hypothetical protein
MGAQCPPPKANARRRQVSLARQQRGADGNGEGSHGLGTCHRDGERMQNPSTQQLKRVKPPNTCNSSVDHPESTSAAVQPPACCIPSSKPRHWRAPCCRAAPPRGRVGPAAVLAIFTDASGGAGRRGVGSHRRGGEQSRPQTGRLEGAATCAGAAREPSGGPNPNRAVAHTAHPKTPNTPPLAPEARRPRTCRRTTASGAPTRRHRRATPTTHTRCAMCAHARMRKPLA